MALAALALGTARPAVAQVPVPAHADTASTARSATAADSLIGPVRPAPVVEPPSPRDTSTSRIEVVGSPSDSSAAEAERVLREAAAHRKGGARAAPPLGRFDAPRWVMLRSAVFPAWGQFHNHAWLKGIGVFAAEVTLGAKIFDDERQLDRLSKAADRAQLDHDEVGFDAAINAYNLRLTDTINRRWFLGGLLAYALADAYVDAHFAHFNVEFDTGKSSGGGSSAKLRLGWSF